MGLKFLEKDEKVSYIADAWELYKKQGIGARNDLYKNGKRPAMMVVDLHESLSSKDFFLKGVSDEVVQMVDTVLENTKKLVDASRRKGFPIIYIISPNKYDLAHFGPLAEKSPGSLTNPDPDFLKTRVVNKRLPLEKGDHIIEKMQASAFWGTPLPQVLSYNKVDTCVIVGATTSGCVRANTVDTISAGYYGVVVEDGCIDRATGPAKAALFDLMTKYSDVAVIEEVMDWIETFPDVETTEHLTYHR